MPHVSLHSDPYTMLVCNVLRAGESVEHRWSAPRAYGLILGDGMARVNGQELVAITLAEVAAREPVMIQAGTDCVVLQFLAARADALAGILEPSQVGAFCSRDHFGQRSVTFDPGPGGGVQVFELEDLRALASHTIERWSIPAIQRLGRY